MDWAQGHRALRGCVQALAPAAVSKSFASIQTDQELQKAGGWAGRRGAGMVSAVWAASASRCKLGILACW